MPLYFYRAISKDGKKVSGSMDAGSAKNVQDQLAAKGLFPVKITPAESVEKKAFSLKDLFSRSITIKEKLFFTKQLAVLLRSGVPLVEALNLLIEQSEKALKSVTIVLRDGIKEGKSLADGLALYPKTFETIYVQLVRAGEASGKLELILERLAEYLERRDELRRKVKGALTYPMIQLGVIGIAVVILLTFVVPQISGMFEAQGAQLPLATRILMRISSFFTSYYLVLLILTPVLYIVYRIWKSTPRGARMVDAIKLRLPVVKYFARTGAVVQFSRTLGMLVEGGVNLSESLDIVCNIVDNRILVDELLAAKEKIVKQGKVAEYLKKTGIFPPIAIYLINTGEQSGQLGEMLSMVGEYYERELTELSDGLAAKLNPLMLLLMAVIIGFIVIAIITPIANIGETISGQYAKFD